MADGNDILKKLKSEVTCPLCLDIFTDPKRLPCEHVYCRECLHDLALKNTKGTSISCPECRRDIPVPNNDVANFCTPHRINSFIEMYRESQKSIDDTEAATSLPSGCKVHALQPLALYCETCEKLVCRDCALLSCARKSHKHGFIDDMVKSYQAELERELQPVKTFHRQLSDAFKDLSITEMELSKTKEAQLQKIDSAFDALSEILSQERVHFRESTMKFCQEQESLNSSKKNEVSQALSEVEAVIQCTEEACRNNPETVFLANVAERKRSIEKVKIATSSLSTFPEKRPEMDAELLSPTEFKENYCHIKNFMFAKEDPLKGHFDRSIDFSAIPMDANGIKITLYFDPHGTKRNVFQKLLYYIITAQLHCHDGTSQKVTLKQITEEQYSLSLYPLKRGKHELHIKYNDTHICGGPITLHFIVEPEKLLKMLSSTKISNVTGIKCYGSKMYVCDTPNNALVLLNPSTKSMEKIINIPGVCEVLIKDDFIYATDSKAHRVMKMDINGSIMKSTGKEGGLFNYPSGIRLSKDNKIYVCDSKNHRLQVFDEDLNLIGVIGRQGALDGCFDWPADLGFDEAGNIYVVEWRNHRIQVLTPEGQHIRNIGRHGSEPGELNCPISVAIQRSMIYVTDSVNKRIAVFKTDGEFVTTFSGDVLTKPEGIAIDDNGYIHVCDNRSQIVSF